MTHFRLGAGAVKSRSSRSGAPTGPGPRDRGAVIPFSGRPGQPLVVHQPIDRAGRHPMTFATMVAVIFRRPYTPSQVFAVARATALSDGEQFSSPDTCSG